MCNKDKLYSTCCFPSLYPCYWYLHQMYAKAEPLSANSCGSVGVLWWVVVASAACGHCSARAMLLDTAARGPGASLGAVQVAWN